MLAEVERRKRRGYAPKTLRQLNASLGRLGYRLDRSCDCLSVNRYITGENAGESYPAINAYVVESDTGLSFAHVSARRDENYRRLQELRFSGELYAVVRGRVLEI
jgi:hypothetical protein